MSAPLVPGQPDSAGSQFLITIVDQPALDGRHSVFGRVVEGIRVAERISEAEIDAAGKTIERIVLRSVTVRDRPPPAPVPFVTETVEELASYRAVLETSFGEIAIAPRPDLAPEHVRNFLRLAEVGVFDGMSFHRVVPGFVVQTGFLPTRDEPLGESRGATRPSVAARVQRHPPRGGDRLDGARRRPRECHDVLLHLHGASACPRRRVTRCSARS